MKNRIPWLAIIAIAFTVLCLVIILLGIYGYINLDSRVRALESQVSPPIISDLQSGIDFLKDQTQHIIWLFGVIISGIGAALAFFGFTTLKSIEEEYKLTYSKLIASKDTEVFKKKIFFLYEGEIDNSLMQFQNDIRARGYNTKWIRATNPDVTSKLKEASIVVYRVRNDSASHYKKVAEWCNEREIHCILYCRGIQLAKEFMEMDLSFISTSIQIAKLRESLYTLLYLTP